MKLSFHQPVIENHQWNQQNESITNGWQFFPCFLFSWIPWNLSFSYILFHEKRLQTTLWHLIARVNSHQRWKQTRNRVYFHLWCELTSTMRCNGMTSFMEFMITKCWCKCKYSSMQNTQCIVGSHRLLLVLLNFLQGKPALYYPFQGIFPQPCVVNSLKISKSDYFDWEAQHLGFRRFKMTLSRLVRKMQAMLLFNLIQGQNYHLYRRNIYITLEAI